MSEEPEPDRKEAIKEKTLERRFGRRSERRTHRLETVIPEDRFTKTADYVGAILTGEIIASKITGVIPGAPPIDEPRLFGDRTPIIERRERERRKITLDMDHPQTQITDKTDFTISDYYLIIDSESRGVCSEISIRSPNQNFSLSVIIDDIKQFDRAFSQFVTFSPQSVLIDAFRETTGDELYVLGIGELSWRRSCQAIVRVTESIIFANIFMNMKEFLI